MGRRAQREYQDPEVFPEQWVVAVLRAYQDHLVSVAPKGPGGRPVNRVIVDARGVAERLVKRARKAHQESLRRSSSGP